MPNTYSYAAVRNKDETLSLTVSVNGVTSTSHLEGEFLLKALEVPDILDAYIKKAYTQALRDATLKAQYEGVLNGHSIETADLDEQFPFAEPKD